MKTEILISCDEWENRVAVLEEGSLAEIYFEREEKVIGSIYKGRVENVLPGMGACFVNIGLGRNAFLYVDDILRDPINIGETEITDRRKGHTVSELLKVGSDVLVQIVKEPRGLKGARVSTNISLPGRYLVLMPTGRYSGVSSRIEDDNDRARLKQIMRRVRPEGMATIVRTAAQGVSEAELIADLGVQLRLWHGILESYKRATAPALLHKDLNLVFKAVRDFLTSDVTAVYIDSKEQYEEIRNTMSLLGPQYINRLKLVEGPGTLFAQRGIDEELQKLLKPKIPLPSGGHLVLEHTEALTVIDVNTGKFTGGRNLEDTIVRTNLEAAAEIARQVRLRDIGGIIVVDFIDMAHEHSREQVIQTLTESLRRDRTRSTIQVFSNLGLLEFTRKRVGKDLAGQLRSDCPYCSGLGSVMSSETVAIGVLRQIRGRVARNGGVRKFDVIADPAVATQLLGWYHDELEKLARDHDLEVALYVEPERHREDVVVEEARRLRAAPVTGSVIETEMLPVRLPNPASGVAVVNGYLIEVKDGANATGQTVKLKVDAAEGNLVRAELAEPVPSAGRRRRRERARSKEVAASEAPIAPPVPTLREVEIPEDGRQRRGEETGRRAARGRRPETVAFSIADDEETGEVAPRRAAPVAYRGRSAAKSGTAKADMGRSSKRRTARSRGIAPAAYPPPLVVGGEGDIDYDDGDHDATITAPASAPATRQGAAAQAEVTSGTGRRRRRRRGRGNGHAAERPSAGATSVADETQPAYEEDDAIVTPHRSVAPSGGRVIKPKTRAPYAGVDEDGEDLEDGMEAVVNPRQPGAGQRQPKRFGPVRQIYGRPVPLDDTRQRQERVTREEPRGKRAQAAYPQPKPQTRRPRAEDELDVVVRPKAPAAIRVEARGEAPVRRRPAFEEGREHRERRDSGGPRFGAPSRGRPQSPKRQGPTVRQLYPPPDQEDDRPVDTDSEAAAPKPGFGRQPRGPLMRAAHTPPVPKGKVRQLYPPPEIPEELPSSEEDSQTHDRAAFDEPEEDIASSVFISDTEELEDRRRRARERAEARRRAEAAEQAMEASSESNPEAASRPLDAGSPESDEWPVF